MKSVLVFVLLIGVIAGELASALELQPLKEKMLAVQSRVIKMARKKLTECHNEATRGVGTFVCSSVTTSFLAALDHPFDSVLKIIDEQQAASKVDSEAIKLAYSAALAESDRGLANIVPAYREQLLSLEERSESFFNSAHYLDLDSIGEIQKAWLNIYFRIAQ